MCVRERIFLITVDSVYFQPAGYEVIHSLSLSLSKYIYTKVIS